MAITNEEAIRFSNEQVRPTAEIMRNNYYQFKSMLTEWYSGMNTLIPNDAGEVLEDDRPDASDLSGADITNLVTQISAYCTQMEQSGVLDVVSKPCVRHLEV